VTQEQLASAPQITPLFKQAQGGLAAVLGAMRFSLQDEVIAAFLKKYDSILDSDRRRLPWEAVAIAAGIDIHHLTGSIMFAIQSYSVNAVKLLALAGHPAVMEKTIEMALLNGGERDRTTIHTGLRFLPTAKGTTVIGNATFGASPSKSDGSEPEGGGDARPSFDVNDDLDRLFPSSTAIQEKLVPIRQRLLPS